MEHFIQVRFKNYKAFVSYVVNLDEFNVLVGPNNSGKSTILGAFRILAEAIRKARAKRAELLDGPVGTTWGYRVNLEGLPVSTENVFHDYEDREPATISFKVSNGNELSLFFPEKGSCLLIVSSKRAIRTPSDFRREFPVTVAFVPVLGPVDHNEPLYQEEAARLALLSFNAARNFRNIWHYFPDDFPAFRDAIQRTWPGMDIKRPEIERSGERPRLHMFCPEERIDRELFWAGFGFQVWCQMLTFLLKAKQASLLIIDEPDIYLHADLQRQLVGVVKNLGPAVLLATHSIEIISEVEPDALLNVDKRFRSARRIKHSADLQTLFQLLGSKLNPILTQLAKTRRALFVEGKDYQIFARFARRLGFEEVSNRGDFAVIEAQGFNPQRVRAFTQGIEKALGSRLAAAVIFDRDYRSDAEVEEVRRELESFCNWATVHECKELENYLIVPAAIQKAVAKRISDRTKRGQKTKPLEEDIERTLFRITDSMKSRVFAQYLVEHKAYQRSKDPRIHDATLTEQAMNDFEAAWREPDTRHKMVPGKEVLSALNVELQERYGINLTYVQIIEAFETEEIPKGMKAIISALDRFRKQAPPELEEESKPGYVC